MIVNETDTLPPDVLLPAKQDRSREKRDRLIKAGAKTFAQYGYDATRITDIAKAAGITVGTFYQRFKDKRAFFDALNSEFVSAAHQSNEEFFQSADPDWTARQFLEAFILYNRDFIKENIGFVSAILTLAPKDSDVTSPIVQHDIHAAELLETALIARQMVARQDLRGRQVFFACSLMKKTFVVMLNNDAGPLRAGDDATISEMVEMMAAYLHIDL
jgi:AcrR family transcriptional regulator